METFASMHDTNPQIISTTIEGIGRHRLPLIVEQTALIFKGSSFTLTVVQITTIDLERIKRELMSKTTQAPAFFQDTAVVLDFQGIDGQNLDLKALLEILRTNSTHPLGVRNADVFQQTEARALGLAVFPSVKKDESRPQQPEPRIKPKLWTQPVRSGQQVYAPGGDLVVLGMVNAGAEVLADGNIHCYSSLRGRALAGVKGDIEARIFTYCLEAELLSVAGFYRMIENIKELPADIRSKPAQIYLSGERVMMEAV